MLKIHASWLAVAAMVVLALALHAGGLLRFAYPLAVLAAGMWLEAVSLPVFVSFVAWLWMLTPLVRRMADLQGGWHDPSLILLAPYLVTAWPAVRRLARALLRLAERVRVPSPRPACPVGEVAFVLIAAAAVLGLPLGFRASPTAAGMAALNFLVPVAFGWAVAAWGAERAAIERALFKTLLAGALVVGLYGIWQFSAPPAWDVEWVRNAEMTSIGQPEALALRVFSTMHSPGVLGFFLLVPMALWLARPKAVWLPAASAATIALVLSQVRTAWIGLAVSAGLIVTTLPHRLRARVIVLVAAASLVVVPLVYSPDLAEMVSTRLATFTQVDADASALSRVNGHLLAIDFVATHPFGGGLGYSDPRMDGVISLNDSTIVATLVQLGVVGALTYAVGLALMLVALWRYYRGARTPEAIGLSSAGLGLLATAWLGAVTAGPPGVFFWLIGGLALAFAREPAAVRAPLRMPQAPPRPDRFSWTPDHAWEAGD